MALPYNPKEKSSILAYAKLLKDKSLREACGDVADYIYSGKGNFGQSLEKYYFGYEPNSKAEADFVEIGMELKSSPLKKLKNNEYRSKERLVLSIIDYFKIVEQNFDNSDFWKKNASLLLIFYLHQEGQNAFDHLIKIIGEWNFPEIDLEVIKKDWELIKQKVLDGKAHELSEGDTFYLGACTKGATAASVRKQPYSTELAKQRAYSLKQGYVNHMVASLACEEAEIYGKLIPSTQVAKKKTLEEIVLEKFEPFYGQSVDQIVEVLGVDLNQKAKGFYASLTKAILGVGLEKEIEEFSKADIIVKTVRLKSNNLPKEDISFPTFHYQDIVEESWDESALKELLERKFFFVFYQFQNNELILRKVRFWNMPFSDIEETRKVWERTKEVISSGSIVKEVKRNIRYTNFPNKKFNKISHVRPHAKNAADVYTLPFQDLVTGEMEYTKHCFWFNSGYVRDEIYLKNKM